MCVLALLAPNSEVTKLIFFKILKPCATFIVQIKVKRPCMNDGNAGMTIEAKLR